MKKLSLVLGSIFLSIIILSSLFKVMHWYGADFGLILGMAGLALVFVPLLMVSVLNKKRKLN